MTSQVNEKLAKLREDLDQQAGTLKRHDDTLYAPHVKAGLVRTNRGMEKAHRRITATDKRLADLAEAFGLRFDTDGNLVGNNKIMDMVEQALAAGQGGRKSFIQALRDAQVDDAMIRDTLIIVDDGNELDLTDGQLFTELFTAFVSIRTSLVSMNLRVRQTETTHAALARDVHDLQQVAGANGEHIATRTWVTEQVEEGSRTSAGAVGLGIILGLIVFFIAGASGFGTTGYTHDSEGNVNGSFLLNYHSWIIAALLGGATFALVLFLSSFRNSRRRTETTETTQVQQTDNRRRRARFSFGRGQNATQAPGQAQQPAAPAPAPDGNATRDREPVNS